MEEVVVKRKVGRPRKYSRKLIICIHCKRECARFARELCQACYYNEDIRPLYPPKKVPKPWMANEVERVRAMAARKVTNSEIAKIFGRTKSSVASLLFREGIRKSAKRITPAQEKWVVRLCGRNLSDSQIAGRVGLTIKQVQHARARYGMPRNVSLPESSRRASAVAKSRYSGLLPFNRRHHDNRLAAARAGWPAGTSYRQFKVLEALRSGPATRPEISERLRHKCSRSVLRTLKALKEIGWLSFTVTSYRCRTWKIEWEAIRRAREMNRTEFMEATGVGSGAGRTNPAYEKDEDFLDDWDEAG